MDRGDLPPVSLFRDADHLPPSNVPAECALLGAILANNRAFDFCAGLEPEHFADPVNAIIFGMCKRRIELGRPVDAVTLNGALANSHVLEDVGGTAYLTGLLTAMVSIIGVGEYAIAIRDAYTRRELLLVAEAMRERAYGKGLSDDDGAATLAWTQHALDGLGAAAGTVPPVGLGDAMQQALDQSAAAARGERRALGLLTGIDTLDDVWGGLYAGSLDIIGARPRSGKTSLAMQISRHAGAEFLRQGEGGIAIFSLEMAARDLGLVNLASMTGISADDIRRGRYDSAQAHQLILAQRDLAKLPIVIFDKPAMTLTEAAGICRALKRKKGGLRLAVFDHRNLIGREEEWAKATKLDFYQHITKRLKELAKLLSISVVCLVQIGRGVEGRDDPRPRMSDLEYAGEQDSDNIVLLHRPALTMVYPQRKTNETSEQHANKCSLWYALRADLEKVCEAMLVKRRFGAPGTVKLQFTGKTTSFADWPMVADTEGEGDLI